MLTDRVNTLSESITIAISTLAQELKAQGKNILSFSAGEPDFDTPQVIAGDEVIIPAPYWVTYPELVMYCGGSVVEIMTDDSSGFKITPEQLKTALTPKTKMLILTSPSNPTGAVYTREELIALGKVLEGTNVLVASDEMYEKLIYDGEFTSAAAVSDDMFQRTITINGLSKSVAMTGWRFGYMAAANTEIIQATKKLQSQSTSNINSITQKAAIVGLNGEADADIEAMRVQFKTRRDEAVKLFNEIDGLSVLSPAGAFYLFVNIKKVNNDSMQFCKELLEEQGVAVVPGVGFGSEGYFRFSFATDIESIRDGIKRIATFVASKK
ncbi:MAG: pyridoxal phosphate-dependent aminotransferase [Epsilonproteobacteria bacterium]|nr:pyridoxal phosphate-dependent aminotransferase [Campylobacterota bacterium]